MSLSLSLSRSEVERLEETSYELEYADRKLRSGGPSSFFPLGMTGERIFPFACSSNFALPRKKNVPSQVTADCQSQLRPILNFAPRGRRGYLSSLLGEPVISDFGLTQGINRAREDEFVILA